LADISNIPNLISIGVIKGVRGLKGELRVLSESPSADRLNPGDSVYIGDDIFHISAINRSGKGLLFKLHDIVTREEAQSLIDYEIQIINDKSPLHHGEYYHNQLIGMNVYDNNNIYLGYINEIIVTGANDVYVIHDTLKKDILVPAISDVVVKIDVESSEMTVNLFHGLNTR